MWISKWFLRLFLVYATLIVLFVIALSLLASPLAQGRMEQMRWIWGTAGLAIVLGLVTMWYTMQAMVTPLVELTKNVQRTRLEESTAASATNSDEMGILADAFSQMQRQLASRVDDLQQNSSHLQAVLENMIEGVLAISADKTILLANDASRRMLDIRFTDPAGKSLLEVTRARPVFEAVEQALGSSQAIEREFESSGVQRRTVALRATRLPGNPSPGAMVVLHDVSELRRLESLRREFVAGVSHELKTPLAAIKAYAETLRMGAVNDPENNLNFVLRIEEQAERLHQLILDLLQIARVEAGQEVFEITTVYVRDVFDECQSQFADVAANRKVQLDIESPISDVAVLADEEGVRTILSNLVDNALKYTPEGGKVCVRCVEGKPSGMSVDAGKRTATKDIDWLCLEVSDSGIGIAEKDQARVFERFFRVDKARSRELGGTGLGLSIVKHFVQAFGGSVAVESQLRQGSKFRVLLPRAENPS